MRVLCLGGDTLNRRTRTRTSMRASIERVEFLARGMHVCLNSK